MYYYMNDVQKQSKHTHTHHLKLEMANPYVGSDELNIFWISMKIALTRNLEITV